MNNEILKAASQDRSALHRIVVLGTPLLLGLVELWHPLGNPQLSAFDNIMPIVDQWITVHVLQVPLFGLIALAVYLLVDGLHAKLTTISRTAIAFFAVFYTVLDAVVGLATGILVRNGLALPVDERIVIEEAVHSLWWDPVAGNRSIISGIGVLGWIIGVLTAALAFRRAGAPRTSVVLLTLAGLTFWIHARPFGPFGMACFFLSAVLIERWKSRLSRVESPLAESKA